MLNCAQHVHDLLRSKRIAIVGNQGAGKTTLAERLADILQIPYVEVPWRLSGMTAAEASLIREQMSAREAWIIDGDFGLLGYADILLLLDFPLSLCLWRATKRSVSNFLSWDFASIRVAGRVPGKVAELLRFLKMVSEYSSAFQTRDAVKKNVIAKNDKVIVLKSPKEAQRLVSALECARRSPPPRGNLETEARTAPGDG